LRLSSGVADDALRVDVGLTDDSGGLFLSDTQNRFEAASESGVAGGERLTRGCFDGGNLFLESAKLRQKVSAILGGLDELSSKVVDDLVDFAALIPAELRRELLFRICHKNVDSFRNET